MVVMSKNTDRLKENSSEKLNSKLSNNSEQKEFQESIQAREAVESIGMSESVESMGNVSESSSEDKSKDMGASGNSSSSNDSPASIKEKLLENLPKVDTMKSQIEKEIKKEIDYLHNKAMKMARTPGQVNHYELNNILKKIRELKQTLGKLIKAPLEAVKTLWLRYVHGIM